MIKTYYLLTKPGIIIGNLITVAAGFALASKNHFNFFLCLMTLIGLGAVIASACVFNNYIDRSIDQKMERTKKRALASGAISNHKALLFAVVLGLSGFSLLFIFTNLLTVGVASFGFFIYVVMYSFWKKSTDYATLVGSMSGAVPPVVGYVAVSNQLDLPAALLFLIMVLWQMPHFFSIAINHLEDYTKAAIPVLPVKKGLYVTKIQMALYIAAFIFTTLLLSLLGYTGSLFLICALSFGFIWLGLSLSGFKCKNDRQWSRKMFVFSLLTITSLSVIIPFDIRG